MYKVMIVEDEMLVRIGMRNSVDWAKFNMQIISDLPDGQMAWHYCLNEGFPDLIITDIRMPKMDGMELIASVRKENKNTRLVVLSCLEEFELVRQAMSLGVSNYILKLTMTEEEIETVLNGVRAELDTQAAAAVLPKDENRLGPGNLDLVKEKYIKDFLFYGIYSAEEFEKFSVRNSLRLAPVRLLACVMEVDSYSNLKRKFKDKNGHLIKATLLNILHEIMNTYKRGETIYLDETHYLLLFSFDDMLSEQSIKQELYMMLNTIKDAIQTYSNSSVSFGISGMQSGYKSLRKLYMEAAHLLEGKFLSGPGLKHAVGDHIDPGLLHLRIEKLRMDPSVREMLSPMKLKEYDQHLSNLAAFISAEKTAIRIMLHQFIQWINANIYDDANTEKELLLKIAETLNESDTLPEMLEHASDYVARVVEQSKTVLHMSGEISKAIQFIKLNYDQNISLQQVADHVNLSFGYLSNLFKKETQITFVEYLNNYRIERAKELLEKTQMKTYDVAVKVGFSPEYTYFSKVFKKVTGLNPNEYRRHTMSGSRGAD
jgi:two-component system response regulator YesN